MADRQFAVGGQESAPASWTLPEALEIIPKTAYASYDGSGAAGSFVPCLRIISDSGHVALEAVAATTVAAGASADVSWFRGLAVQGATSSGGSGPAVLFDSTATGTVASIGTAAGGIDQTHKDLLIVTTLRSSEAIVMSNSGGLSINANTANAKQNYLRVFNTTVSGNTAGSGAQGVNVLALCGANADANTFGRTFVYVPDYTSGKVMACLFICAVAPQQAATTNWIVDVGQGKWNAQTGPITQMTAVANLGGGGQLVAGSRMTIYGLG